jgi:hypothetical protein
MWGFKADLELETPLDFETRTSALYSQVLATPEIKDRIHKP